MGKTSFQPDKSRFLVNKLTIADARLLLRSEGGPFRLWDAAMALVTIVITSWLSARAIGQGGAAVWHLLLPLLAQYLVLLIAMPVLQIKYRLPAAEVEVKKCRWGLIVILVLVSLGTWISGLRAERTWVEQSHHLSDWLVKSITHHEMHWPMLSAAIGLLWALPWRFRNCQKLGPPFLAVNLGCAAKVLILLAGCFLLPMILSNARSAVWWLWTLFLLGELVALGMILDIQRRLRRLDSKSLDG